MQNTRSIMLIAVAVAFIGVAARTSAQQMSKSSDPSVLGKWTLQADTPHGKMALALELKRDPKDAKKLVGTMASDGMGEFTVTGEFVEGKLTFDVKGGPSEMTFAGKFKDKDTLSGVMSGHAGDMAVIGTRVVAK